jgi:hypothetical protein
MKLTQCRSCTTVIMSPVSNAPLPFAPAGQYNTVSAFEVSATVNESNVVPKRERCAFPEFNACALTHDPLSIFRVQEYLRVETFRPFDHRRVKVRMRNSDRADAAAPSLRRPFCRRATKWNPKADFRGAIGVEARAGQWQIPVPCRYREGAALPPQTGCGGRSLTFRASSTADLRGEQIAVRLRKSGTGAEAAPSGQTAFRTARR